VDNNIRNRFTIRQNIKRASASLNQTKIFIMFLNLKVEQKQEILNEIHVPIEIEKSMFYSNQMTNGWNGNIC